MCSCAPSIIDDESRCRLFSVALSSTLLCILLSLEYLLRDLNRLSSPWLLKDLKTSATVTMWSCRTCIVPIFKTDSVWYVTLVVSSRLYFGGQVLQKMTIACFWIIILHVLTKNLAILLRTFKKSQIR